MKSMASSLVLGIAGMGAVTAAHAQLVLGPPPFQPALKGAESMSLADLDGDGLLDLVSLSTEGGALQVRFGMGRGLFGFPAVAVTPDLSVARAAAADLDGDGHPDIVAARILGIANQVFVLHGLDGASFDASFETYDLAPVTSLSKLWLHVGDADGDGDVDVLEGVGPGAFDGDGVTTLLLNDGTGTLHPGVVTTTLKFTGALAADLDGDGIADVVGHSGEDVQPNRPPGTTHVLHGLAQGGYEDLASWPDARAVTIQDLNGDGVLDVLTCGVDGSVAAHLGAGNATFTDGPVEHYADLVGAPLACADLDGDATPDLVLLHAAPQLLQYLIVLRGTGDGGFELTPAGKVTTGTVREVLASDVVADGRIDLVTSTPTQGVKTLPNLTYPEGGPLADLGHSLNGLNGWPGMLASGTFEPREAVTLTTWDALFQATTLLVCGAAEINAPFKGGVLVPTPDVVFGPFLTDINGRLSVTGRWPGDLPSGSTLTFQYWIEDKTGAAPQGFAASTAVRFTRP